MDPVSLEHALGERCKNGWWLLWIFFLTSTPGIFNSMHITSYVFLGGDPSFWCNVPVLRSANWTNEQIRNISSPNTGSERCTMYNWNYTYFAEIGYEVAVQYTNSERKPDFIKCNGYIYDEKVPKETIVSEWDLVCDNLPLRSTAQVAVALGKFFGAFVFGLFGDRFGRKKIFALCCLIYIAAGPAGAFVTSYVIFLILRILIGIAGSGVYEAGYTILSELTVRNYRAYLGCLYNVSYSVGFVLLPLAAYFTHNWRDLQLAISVPTVILLIHCWFLPESPRWLITRGKLEMASKVLGQDLETTASTLSILSKGQTYPCHEKIIDFLKCFLKLFSTTELQKRILICYFAWFVAQLYYYAIALNGSNFSANQYLYVGLNGLAEVPGYLLPILILPHIGRRPASVSLFVVSGLALFTIFFVPKGWPVMLVAMIGRLAVSAVFAVIIIQTSELFPTEHRNSAIGSSLTMAQLGTMGAPYLVDIVGKEVAWYLPSTICGALALLCAAFLLLLPETKDLPMVDTIKEMEAQSRQIKPRQDQSTEAQI